MVGLLQTGLSGAAANTFESTDTFNTNAEGSTPKIIKRKLSIRGHTSGSQANVPLLGIHHHDQSDLARAFKKARTPTTDLSSAVASRPIPILTPPSTTSRISIRVHTSGSNSVSIWSTPEADILGQVHHQYGNDRDRYLPLSSSSPTSPSTATEDNFGPPTPPLLAQSCSLPIHSSHRQSNSLSLSHHSLPFYVTSLTNGETQPTAHVGGKQSPPSPLLVETEFLPTSIGRFLDDSEGPMRLFDMDWSFGAVPIKVRLGPAGDGNDDDDGMSDFELLSL